MLRNKLFGRLFYAVVLTWTVSVPAAPIMFGVNDNTDTLWSFDLDAGTGVSVGRIEENGRRVHEIESLAFDPASGLLFGVQDRPLLNSVLYAIDPVTAEATRIGSVGFRGVESLTFNPRDGLLYAAGNAWKKTNLLTLDLSTGAGSLVASFSLKNFGDLEGLAWDASGLRLLASAVKNSGSTLMELNPSLGTAGVVGSLGHRKVEALEFGPDGVLYAASDSSNKLLMVDPLTGTTRSLDIDACLSDIEGIAFQTPEPSSVALLLSGAAMAIRRLWKR